MTDEVAVLISCEITTNEFFQKVVAEKGVEILCQKGSISQNEFFSGGRQGLKPSFKLVVATCDYSGEEELEFHGKRYVVYRTYESGDYSELYCTEKGGVK